MTNFRVENLPAGATHLDKEIRNILAPLANMTNRYAGVVTGGICGAIHVVPGLLEGFRTPLRPSQAADTLKRLSDYQDVWLLVMCQKAATGNWKELIEALRQNPCLLGEKCVNEVVWAAQMAEVIHEGYPITKTIQTLRKWSKKWQNRLWIYGRVGTFIYEGGGSFDAITRKPAEVWGKQQVPETRRKEFNKALPFVVRHVTWLANQWVKANASASAPNKPITHVMTTPVFRQSPS